MIHLYTQKEFDKAKSRDLLPLKCKICEKTFYRSKNNIQKQIKGIEFVVVDEQGKMYESEHIKMNPFKQ